MSTPYRDAVDAFKDSDAWLDCTNPGLSNDPAITKWLLENRCLSAFEAGWNARDAINGGAPE